MPKVYQKKTVKKLKVLDGSRLSGIKICISYMIIFVEGNISGRAFLRYSKEDWTGLNISLGGIYTLMDLQEEVSNHSSYKEKKQQKHKQCSQVFNVPI